MLWCSLVEKSRRLAVSEVTFLLPLKEVVGVKEVVEMYNGVLVVTKVGSLVGVYIFESTIPFTWVVAFAEELVVTLADALAATLAETLATEEI